jgi:hypothetical protein
MRDTRKRVERVLALLKRMGLAEVRLVQEGNGFRWYSVVVQAVEKKPLPKKQRLPLAEKPGTSPFLKHPPSAEEVSAYLAEIDADFSAEDFLLGMERRGWTWGKARNPVVNWKAEARTWKRTRERQKLTGHAYADDPYKDLLRP